MPVKPQPVAYVCQSCGWKKIIHASSDALILAEIVKSCPQCKSHIISKKHVSILDFALSILKSLNRNI